MDPADQGQSILDLFSNRVHVENIAQYMSPAEPGFHQIRQNWTQIHDKITRGRWMNKYNQVILDENVNESINRLLVAVHGDMQTMYKAVIEVGFLGYNLTEDRYKYFYPSYNTQFLRENNQFVPPQLISNTADLRDLMQRIDGLDVIEACRQSRPSSKWTVIKLVHVTVKTFRLRDDPIRGVDRPMPDHIRNNPHIVSLDIDPVTKEPYTDSLCFFRALSAHKSNSRRYTTNEALSLLLQWPGLQNQFPKVDLLKLENQKLWLRKNFQGVKLSQLDELENWLQIGIRVFSLQPDGSVFTIRRSSCNYQTHLDLNLHDNHFSYITNLNGYTKTWKCTKCSKILRGQWYYNRHTKHCKGATKYNYPGGFYRCTPTIFEQLNAYQVDIEKVFYPWYANFDFESYSPDGVVQQILSVSVASNVAGFEGERCFVNEGSESAVVRKMIKYLNIISKKASTLAWQLLPLDEIESLNIEENNSSLWKRINRWACQLPVLGFNSSKFDIPLIRRFLANEIHQSTDAIIIQENKYSLVSTDKLVFLDVRNFLAPDYSYAKFLTAYDTDASKGHWPYEYIKSLEQLNEQNLPPQSAFHSSLKKSDISSEDYEELKNIWESKGMTCLRDLLIWYNNLGNSLLVI